MKKTTQVITVAGLIAIAVLSVASIAKLYPSRVSAKPWIQEPPTHTEDAAPPQQGKITSTDLTQEELGIQYPLLMEKNGIKIEVLSTQIEGGFLGVDICFDFPTNDPAWDLGGPENIIVSNGLVEVGAYSIDLIGDLITDGEGHYIGRCDHVQFPIQPGFKVENLQLTIKKLVTDTPEVPDCATAQAKLDAEKSGIVIQCIHETGPGGGMGGFELVSMPESMERSDAYDLVLAAMQESVEGPWVFQLPNP